MDTPNDIVIACENLTKGFSGPNGTVRVLEEVTLEAPAGKLVVITGRSGAGKSTLLNLLAGLDKPDAGRVVLLGQSLHDLPNGELAQLRRLHVGIIFQSFNLMPSWTAQENVQAPLMHSGMPRRQRREKAAQMLGVVGLADRADHLPAQLSVGQQQRVAIARAMVRRPSLILADEPTGDVDPQTAGEIIDQLLSAVVENGSTLVVATHGLFPLDNADRVYLLESGRLSQQ